MERRAPDVVARIDTFAIRNHHVYSWSVSSRDGGKEAGRALDIHPLGPLALIDWVEAAGYALTAGIFHNESAEN